MWFMDTVCTSLQPLIGHTNWSMVGVIALQNTLSTSVLNIVPLHGELMVLSGGTDRYMGWGRVRWGNKILYA